MSHSFVARCMRAATLFLPVAVFGADNPEVEHAADLETVVVTASPIGDPDRLATIAGSVDRSALLRSGAATLADGLSQVPGVTS
ncbi:MAG TPA: hypothetical protein VN645_01850, partial [Steroidobacteraceae bacterium]|nr:hypothetical protein [Steroidobacteraceae bacterium]